MCLGIRTASLWSCKMRKWLNGRKGLFERLSKAIAPNDRVVWVHCSSLGEFEQGRPVIEELRRLHPEYKILLTFFSPSGYEIRHNYEGADWVFYMPADTPRAARRFVAAVHPEKAVFVKYEFWLNHLAALRRSGCDTYLISAIFRPKQVFFKPRGGNFRRALRGLRHLFVQDEASARLLSGIGVEQVTIAGDTRFDRVAALAAAAPAVDTIERFAAGGKLFLAGSTWAPDEELLLEVIDRNPRLKFVVAPHEMDEGRIAHLVARCKGGALRYTELTPESNLAAAQLLIIDTIGILSSAYRYATYAYIGGGFGVGIHNTLEAATFGLPIAFGPNYERFREARDMVALGCAASVADAAELNLWLTRLGSDREAYDFCSHCARSYVERNCGATQTILEEVFGERGTRKEAE